jgi:catechol 2,3-dioxygenase
MHIGHDHLKVADLDRSIAFYRDVLGFELRARMPGAAFLGDDGYHHHIGLNTWSSEGGGPPPPAATGLFHLAILFEEREQLAAALRRVLDAGVQLTGASDHGVSEAIYFNDPDLNGIEIYWDRPREEWPTNPDGTIAMYTAPLDLGRLLAA